MQTLHRRLGLAPEQIGSLEPLQGQVLSDPDTLFDYAFQHVAEDPKACQTVLAAALLAQARKSSEGRLAGSLALLSRLVAQANPNKTLGIRGAPLRDELMPNGWRYTAQSFLRLRYAWRGGLRELLDVQEDCPIADALDEITRLNPSEPEPVSVAIQEQYPPPVAALLITLAGFGLTIYGIYDGHRRQKDLEARFAKIGKKG